MNLLSMKVKAALRGYLRSHFWPPLVKGTLAEPVAS